MSCLSGEILGGTEIPEGVSWAMEQRWGLEGGVAGTETVTVVQ